MISPLETIDLSSAVPHVPDELPFAVDFRYWAGSSGKRYLTRGFPLEMAAEFAGAPVILAAVGEDGRREAVWIGISVGRRFEAGLAAARAVGATEAYVHLLAQGAVDRVAVLRDLRAAAARARHAHRVDRIAA